MSKKTIFLTGGSGFIGRNLIEQLGSRYDIIAPSHKALELTDQAAVTDFFKKQHFDLVIHSAVKPGHRNAPDHTRIFEASLQMFFNLVRNRDKFGKLIFLSSGAVYDIAKPIIKAKEDDLGLRVPVDEHGLAKYIIARHIEQLDNVLELRIFGIFGKYEDYSIRFISNAICKALFDLPITLRQDRKFNYLYIDDLVKVVEYFILNQNKYKAYNVTSDSPANLLEAARMVKAISGKDLPIAVGREGLGLEYSGDNTRLKQEIPGLSFTSLEDGIKKLYIWYKQNQGAIDKSPLLFDK